MTNQITRPVAGIVILLFAFVGNRQLYSQSPRAEWLNVENVGDVSIQVQMRARGRGSYTTDWQPLITIEPGKTKSIRLRGFEPFDIAIHGPELTLYLAREQYICTWMQVCAATGRSEWSLVFRRGRYIKRIDGGGYNFVWETAEDSSMMLKANADEDEVSIRFGLGLVQSDAPRPPRAPPAPPRPKKP